jgi:endonuclease/exonuclease/phosphatase family metal-dependent hydrolase
VLDSRRLQVWTDEGEFEWPRDAAHLIGADHPFFGDIVNDLDTLCRHPDAGDIVMLAWRKGRRPISFVKELGAHAGPGPTETGAFALLSADAPAAAADRAYLRLDDLRRTAERFLKGDRGRPLRRHESASSLRLVSYNVHSCVGLDGRLSPARIARVLDQCDADVIALQELDVNRPRTSLQDQAHEIARLLGIEHVLFHPALSRAEEHYGDAILSRFPLRLVRAGGLPGNDLPHVIEPRGAIWAAVEFAGHPVQVINTHLGLVPEERRVQIEALLGPEWTGHADCRDPVVLLGDFNILPDSLPYRRIVAEFRDCQNALAGHRPMKTWFSPWPLARLDHVFVRGEANIIKVEVPRTHLTAVASDHLPLVIELTFAKAGCDFVTNESVAREAAVYESSGSSSAS